MVPCEQVHCHDARSMNCWQKVWVVSIFFRQPFQYFQIVNLVDCLYSWCKFIMNNPSNIKFTNFIVRPRTSFKKYQNNVNKIISCWSKCQSERKSKSNCPLRYCADMSHLIWRFLRNLLLWLVLSLMMSGLKFVLTPFSLLMTEFLVLIVLSLSFVSWIHV